MKCEICIARIAYWVQFSVTAHTHTHTHTQIKQIKETERDED